jgi:hypothetical protein
MEKKTIQFVIYVWLNKKKNDRDKMLQEAMTMMADIKDNQWRIGFNSS